MTTFYFWVLVVGVMGMSDGESIVCLMRNRNVTCSDKENHQSRMKVYKNKIPVWCNGTEIICPIIPNLNNVSADMKSNQLQCRTKRNKKQKRECEVYYCQMGRPLYVSSFLIALPGKLKSQDWKSKMTDIFEGVTGVKEWLNNKSEEFWKGRRTPQDWIEGTGDFLTKLYDSKDWLKKLADFVRGNKGSDPVCKEGDDDYDEEYKEENNKTNKSDSSIILKIVLPCLAVLLILAICVFLLWRKNRKLQRNLAIGGASDRLSYKSQLGKKMGSISDIDLKNNEFPPVPHRPSHIYQEIPTTQEDPAEILQNPLYAPSEPSSQEQQSGSQDEHPAEGQYSLLQPPTQLQPPDQQ